MKSSQNLFYLIKSLTKAEKRYFTLNVLQQSGNKNYVKLFTEIETQTKNGNYDETLVKSRLKNEKFIRQLTFTKNYLYNLIIKSLINFHTGESIEAKIYNLIVSAKILFRKSLFNDYFRNLETAKILAEKSERFGILLDILKLQMRLVRLKDRKKHRARNLYDEEKAAIKKIENITEYSKLLNAFYKITKIPEHARSKVLYKETVRILDNPLLHSEKSALSVTAKDYHYLLLIQKHEFMENNNELFNIALKRYELCKKNSRVFKSDSENKEANLLYYTLYYSIFSKKNDYYKVNLKYFKAMNEIDEKSDSSIDVSSNYNFLQMNFYYMNHNIKEAISFAEKIFNNVSANEAVQNKDDLLSFYFIYAKLLFENKDFLKSLDIITLIINHEYKDVRYDILAYSYFIEIFIHYELKNYQLANSYIRALTRKLSNHKEKDLSEKIILKFFTELCSESKISEEYVLKKYYKKLSSLKKSKYERVFFNELPIDKWILKKIFKKPLDK